MLTIVRKGKRGQSLLLTLSAASDPDIVATEIVEDLQTALAQFAEIASNLKH